MKFLQTTIANLRALATGDLTPDEARMVKEAHYLLSNGWPGSDGDFEKHPLKKQVDARQNVIRELASGDPERQRKALQTKSLEIALAAERERNQKLRAMRYFDEIPTEQLNLRTAREFCESDIAGRPDFGAEGEDWLERKFPGIADEGVRKEASLIWRWSGIFVSEQLLRYSSTNLEDAEVKQKMLKNFQDHLMILPEQEFARRLDNIAKVASAPVPARMLPYAEFMREPGVLQDLKNLWHRKLFEGLEQKFGWMNRIEEKILIAPPGR
ncbi:hypothetical protein [Bradyrhizobium ottawaense]|uniref:hypothetical protein n=1 Tax=Bradyrhizobium ottawaense TaxID=931866 RepID=UPI0030C6F376